MAAVLTISKTPNHYCTARLCKDFDELMKKGRENISLQEVQKRAKVSSTQARNMTEVFISWKPSYIESHMIETEE